MSGWGGLTQKSGPIFSKYKGEREGGMMGQTHQKYRALCFMKYLSEICLKICHTFNIREGIWSIVVFPLMHPWYVVKGYEKLDSF